MAKSKGRAIKSSSIVSTEIQKPSTPNWPALGPLISPEHLTVEEVVPGQILLIRNFFTSTLCKNYVSFLASLPLKTTPGKPKRGEAVRVNDRYQIDDPMFAEQLWAQAGLKHLVESFPDQKIWAGDEVLGLNPNIRVYRYRPGQFFDQHYDESNKLSFGPQNIPARTTWTLLIYLTSYEGGETAFYPEPMRRGEKVPDPIVVGMEVGMALLHNHDDCMLHEGKEVRSGEKWVLRSDLVVKR